MANQCENHLYIESENEENINTILDFMSDHFWPYDSDCNGDGINIIFTSKWIFPEELMNQLYESLPDKSDIHMRCLSVEYGCMYHALWYCDEDGWHET